VGTKSKNLEKTGHSVEKKKHLSRKHVDLKSRTKGGSLKGDSIKWWEKMPRADHHKTRSVGERIKGVSSRSHC